jgi:GAF domain-containing protein
MREQARATWPEAHDDILHALPGAGLVVDAERRVVAANDAAQAMFGRIHGELVGSLLGDQFADSVRGAVDEILGQVLGGRDWHGDLPLDEGLADASRHAGVSVSAIRVGEDLGGALVLAEPISSPDHRVADQLSRLARVSSELLFAENLDSVTNVVIEHIADAAGATVASLSLMLDDDTLMLAGLRGGREGASTRWATYSVADLTPAGDAVRSGRTLVLSGRAEIKQRYPHLESAAEGERSMICLPLKIADRPLGVATLTFPGKRAFDAAELEFFHLLADICAQAVDRMQALAEVAEQTTKLQFLADASVELASSLDYESTLANVARLAVPQFADWCSIALAQDGALRTLAVAHVDPEKVQLAQDYQARYPSDPESGTGPYEVLRTGRSELTEITDEMLEAAVRDPEQLAILRALNFRSALLVPLKVKDRVAGVITWVTGEIGRHFGQDDVAFGEDLARRAAVAIDNSQLHTELREVAVRLQRAVLPAGLPVLDGWEMAASYLPAGRSDAGGDFYDVLPLADGRLAFFVGDVMGRGVHAAAAMAQMRSAVRTLIAVDERPKVVLSRLDMLFQRFEMDQLVTMVYGFFDPSSDELTLVNAGHPRPVLIRADGTIEDVETGDDLLLGAGPGQRVQVTLPFGPGDLLLAFTDGLIERRDEDIDAGQQRLLEACLILSTGDLSEQLDGLIDAVRDKTSDDDVASLAIRRTPREG